MLKSDVGGIGQIEVHSGVIQRDGTTVQANVVTHWRGIQRLGKVCLASGGKTMKSRMWVAATLLTATMSSVMAADGLELAKASGCLACHAVDKKVVGPAWKDVATKYKGDASARAALVNKVKAGGKGNWTEVTGGVPMPPYSPRVADADIEKLIDFVLGL